MELCPINILLAVASPVRQLTYVRSFCLFITITQQFFVNVPLSNSAQLL